MNHAQPTGQSGVFRTAVLTRNPAWIQLLGLCPLLAVSSTVVNAVGLAAATTIVVVGSNVFISLLRKAIPNDIRLPCFVLIIATFTTLTSLFLEAYAYDVYLKIALFVQIIVTNCMILGRAEAFASKQPVVKACLDGIGTAVGFALALLVLGAVREALGHGTLFANLHQLFGPLAQDWEIVLSETPLLPLAKFAPGAFILSGLLLAAGVSLTRILSNQTKDAKS